ncbi:MAG: TonB-dependent receptor domain-containing protein [Bryobacteraceae bacterium]
MPCKGLLVFAGLALLVAPAFSQEFRASISGQITDASGAAISGAKITVTSVERNTASDAVSNNKGIYLVQFLLPGQYTLAVSSSGFKSYLQRGIALEAANHANVDVRLEIGAYTDRVTVTGDAPLLETETGTRATTVENRVLENVPTNGRNLFALQYNLPGVVKSGTYWGSMELYAYGDVNGVSISGGRVGENETLIDGVSNTKVDRGVSLVPSLSATQEFSVQSNLYDAQYGRVGGGVTSIIVKSGTNRIHGELYEFLKNVKLDANEWTSNKAGLPQRKFENNTWGAEVDGPIILPKLFNGRNRVFFMMSYEGEKENSNGVVTLTLPAPEQRTGDFSKLLNSQGVPVIIYDPKTTRLGPNGTYIRDAFPGNIIPQDRINPIAAKVVQLYPPPNTPGIGPNHLVNYARLAPGGNKYTALLGKIDLNVSSKSKISFRYGQTPYFAPAATSWGNNPGEPATYRTQVPRNWGADWTYVISPSLIFNLRGGLARYEQFSGSGFAGGYDPRQLGFPSSLVSQFTALQFPRFNFGPYSPIGASSVTNYSTNDTWSVQPNVSWIHGRHALRFGMEARLYNRNTLQPGLADGSYTFGKNWTQANPLRADSASGNEVASFLLGLPVSGSVDHNIDPAYQNKYYAIFLQDDIKLTRNLTINAGLRWDYETPLTERYNRMVRGFAFNQASPLATQVPGLDLKGGLLFAGNSGDSRLAFNPDRTGFQPRIGFAWRPASAWVIRGGYGLTYLGQSSFGPPTGFSRPTPLIGSTDGGITPAIDLSNPFPPALYPAGLLTPIGSSLGLSTNLGQAVSAQYLDRSLPRSHQFSFGFQRELRWGFLADVSYVGNITHALPVNLALNSIPANVLNSMPVDARPAYFSAAVPNPLAGLLPSSSLNGATIPRSQLFLPFPQYSGVMLTDVPIGSQRYHSVQMKLARRFSQGIGIQAAYTISKSLERVSVLNPQDVNLADPLKTPLEQRLNQWDTPRKFSVVVTAALPYGHGKQFGSNANPVLNAIAGGWNFNAEYNTQVGFPFDFPNAAPLAARSAKLSDAQRDSLAKQAGHSQWDPSVDPFFDVSLFPTEAQAPFTLRNFPTRFPDVRGKPLNNVEFSAYKEFQVRERLRWQIRADFHNALNHPWFGSQASNDVSDSQFGRIAAQSVDDTSEPRLIVLSMKLVF